MSKRSPLLLSAALKRYEGVIDSSNLDRILSPAIMFTYSEDGSQDATYCDLVFCLCIYMAANKKRFTVDEIHTAWKAVIKNHITRNNIQSSMRRILNYGLLKVVDKTRSSEDRVGRFESVYEFEPFMESTIAGVKKILTDTEGM